MVSRLCETPPDDRVRPTHDPLTDNTEAAHIASIRLLQVGEVFERGGSSWRVTEVEVREDGWHITVETATVDNGLPR